MSPLISSSSFQKFVFNQPVPMSFAHHNALINQQKSIFHSTDEYIPSLISPRLHFKTNRQQKPKILEQINGNIQQNNNFKDSNSIFDSNNADQLGCCFDAFSQESKEKLQISDLQNVNNVSQSEKSISNKYIKKLEQENTSLKQKIQDLLSESQQQMKSSSSSVLQNRIVLRQTEVQTECDTNNPQNVPFQVQIQHSSVTASFPHIRNNSESMRFTNSQPTLRSNPIQTPRSNNESPPQHDSVTNIKIDNNPVEIKQQEQEQKSQIDRAFNFTVRMHSQEKQQTQERQETVSNNQSQGTAEFNFIQQPHPSSNSHILAMNDFLPPASPNSSDLSCLHLPTSLKFTSSNSSCIKSNVKLRYQKNEQQDKTQQEYQPYIEQNVDNYEYKRNSTIDSLTISQQTSQDLNSLNDYFPNFKSFQTSNRRQSNNDYGVNQQESSHKSQVITPTSSHIKRKAAGFMSQIDGQTSTMQRRQQDNKVYDYCLQNDVRSAVGKRYLETTPESSFVVSQIESEITKQRKGKLKKKKSFLENVKLIQKAIRQWIIRKGICSKYRSKKVSTSAASSASRSSSQRNKRLIRLCSNTTGSRNTGYEIINIKSGSSLIEQEENNSLGSPVFLKIQSSKNTNRNQKQQSEKAVQHRANQHSSSTSQSSSSSLLTTHLMNSINCVRKFRQKLKQDSEKLRIENEQILSFDPLPKQKVDDQIQQQLSRELKDSCTNISQD